jgi:hypothetical protein
MQVTRQIRPRPFGINKGPLRWLEIAKTLHFFIDYESDREKEISVTEDVFPIHTIFYHVV